MQLDLDSFKRKSISFVNRILRDLRNISGKLAKGFVGGHKRINTLGDPRFSLSGSFHFAFEYLRKIFFTNIRGKDRIPSSTTKYQQDRRLPHEDFRAMRRV